MRFEFGNLYKFLVSAGVVLISLSVLMPWLILREPIEVIFQVNEYEELQERSRKLVNLKQDQLAWAIGWVPYISGGLFSVGLFVSGFGLWKWSNVQGVADRREQIALRTEEQRLRDMTEQESKEKLDSEVLEAFGGEPKPDESKSFVVTYREIESKIAARLRIIFAGSHSVLIEQKVGGARIDIVLRGNIASESDADNDYVVEVKFARQPPSYSRMSSAYLQAKEVRMKYERSQKRFTKAILIFVVADDAWDREKFDVVRRKIRSEVGKHNQTDLIAGFSVSEMHSLPETAFAERLGL